MTPGAILAQGMLGGSPFLASMLGIMGFLGGTAVSAMLLFGAPRLRRPMLGMLAWSTCYIIKPFYQEVFFVNYRGVDRGFGVTITDMLLFGFLLFILMGGQKLRKVWWPWNTGLWLLVLAVSAVSLLFSPVAYYGLFTLHKFIRGYLLYWVIVNAVRERRDVEAILWGLVAAALHQSWVVFYDKYITGEYVYRSLGSFPHYNSLAMYMNMILPVILVALLSAPARNRWLDALRGAAVLGGVVCVVFTKSRAALVIGLCALGVVSGLSLLLWPTRRKVRLLAIGAVGMIVLTVLAAPRIVRRFETAPSESGETRQHFNRAALAMARDRFWGTGLNSYSWMLRNTDYYWLVYQDALDAVEDLDEFRASAQGESRMGTAHHIYLLMAAETGWLGMIVFCLFLAWFLFRNVVLLFFARDDYYGALLIGLLLGFVATHLNGFLEWVLRQTQVFFLFWVMSGLMVAIGRVVMGERLARRRDIAAAKAGRRAGAAAVQGGNA
ncbi:MAG TPA: O-antigen ligase family protein [Candidatus Brocadiia bacterium]|nr:O-antigen ligase family protein [Candidatus Brocadiia bacterium]